MLHRLTIGHLDTAAVERRQTVPTKALEMDVVHRLLAELGEKDAEGNVTLGGSKVKFENAAVSCIWKGGRTNRVVEEFALRMQKENRLRHRRCWRLPRHSVRGIGRAERAGEWGTDETGLPQKPGPVLMGIRTKRGT